MFLMLSGIPKSLSKTVYHSTLPLQRSLVDYSPWGHKELDMTEQLMHTHTLAGMEIRLFPFMLDIVVVARFENVCQADGHRSVI